MAKNPHDLKVNQELYVKLTKLGYISPIKGESRANPYTGKSWCLPPRAVQLYDFITTRHHVCGKDYTRKDWDRARMIFLECWPDQYYDLID